MAISGLLKAQGIKMSPRDVATKVISNIFVRTISGLLETSNSSEEEVILFIANLDPLHQIHEMFLNNYLPTSHLHEMAASTFVFWFLIKL